MFNEREKIVEDIEKYSENITWLLENNIRNPRDVRLYDDKFPLLAVLYFTDKIKFTQPYIHGFGTRIDLFMEYEVSDGGFFDFLGIFKQSRMRKLYLSLSCMRRGYSLVEFRSDDELSSIPTYLLKEFRDEIINIVDTLYKQVRR